MLHDTVEDTEADLSDIAACFGSEVAALVTAMTEDESIEDFGERKAALRAQIAAAGPDATAVYAADKVTKVRELRAGSRAGPRLLSEDEGRRAQARALPRLPGHARGGDAAAPAGAPAALRARGAARASPTAKRPSASRPGPL